MHTPAEHSLGGKTPDMEIQIIHESIEGNFKNQAVVSFLFESTPGKSNEAISEWNLINLPNPGVPQVEEFF